MLGYGNIIHFCMLILLPVTLMDLLISSHSFVNSLLFSSYNTMSSMTCLSSFFLVWVPFIYFPV